MNIEAPSTAISASISSTISSGVETGFSTAAIASGLSGGTYIPEMSLGSIMSLPELKVDAGSFNMDKTIPGSGSIALNNKLFQVEHSFARITTSFEAVHQESDLQLAKKVIGSIALSPVPEEEKELWKDKIERILGEKANVATQTGIDPVIDETEAIPQTQQEEKVLGEMQVLAQKIQEAEEPAPLKTEDVEEEPTPIDKEALWNIYAVKAEWKTAEAELNERAKTAGRIVHNAFQQGKVEPVLDLKQNLLKLDEHATKNNISGSDLLYPSIRDKAETATNTNTPDENILGITLEGIVYANKPKRLEKHVSLIDRIPESRLVTPAKKLARAGAIFIVFRSAKKTWEAVTSPPRLEPLEIEKARTPNQSLGLTIRNCE